MIEKSSRSGQQGWLIVILLALIFLAQLFSILNTYQQDRIQRERSASYEIRVEEAQKILDLQREVISDLVSDYESLAYDNPNIDRIAEQQLLVSEFQLTGLQALAIQNTQIIELLASAP